MNRSTLFGMFALASAALSGCASPAHIVKADKEAGHVIVAVPEDTNTWPYYHRDEALKVAAANIADPELKSIKRVKVGEQTTNTQDATRRDLGDKDKKIGEIVSSSNTTSTSDKFEYHLEFMTPPYKTELARKMSKVPPPPNPTGPPVATPGAIEPASGTSVVMPPAHDIKPPVQTIQPIPPTSLPPTIVPPPGQ